jgi:glutaredoxin
LLVSQPVASQEKATTMKLPQHHNGPTLAWAALVLLATFGAPAQAQYKVVNPDGSVTYTDRPPVASNVRVTSLNRTGTRAARAQEIALPAELRSVAQRHPVILYSMADCLPCASARKLLQQRGVPYSEKSVITEDDAAALVRLVGGRTLPAMTVGAQPVRGWSELDWNTYLDVAGYPRESRLPPGWLVPEATPLVERVAATSRGPAPPVPPAAPVDAPPPAEEPAQTGTGTRIRF